jgi:hypothetical protein
MKSICHYAATMTKTYSKWRKSKLSGLLQRHHVFQDADRLEMGLDSYTSGLGLVILLMGGSHIPGSPHDLANRAQAEWRDLLPVDQVARKALEAAKCSESDIDTILQAVEEYNESKGWVVK